MTQAIYDTDKLLPEYARAARELHQILSKMKVNDYLMPERQLCVQLGVSRVTLRRALDYFHKQKILGSSPGRGTWLERPLPLQTTPNRASLNLISLVVPSVQEPFISRIVHGAEQVTADRGFHLVLAQDHCDAALQIQQLHRIAESATNGIAVFPDASNLLNPDFLALLRRIQAKDIPLVIIDQYAPGLDVPCVLSDNYTGAYLATQHLILSGRRKLGLLSFGASSTSNDQDRRKGFLAALEDHHLAPRPVCEAELGAAGHETLAQDAVRQWLTKGANRASFDGIFCMQDNMAYGAYLALREAGLRVPEDVALVGFDNLNRELYQAAGLELTSIDQNPEQMGSDSVRLLIDKIEGREQGRGLHLLLKPKLVVRSSCGTPRPLAVTEAVTTASPNPKHPRMKRDHPNGRSPESA